MPKKEVDMVSPFVSDGHLSSVSDDLFDFDVVNQCDYDFPMEDLEGNQMPEDWVARLQHLELPPDDLTCGLSTPFTVKLFDDNSLSYTSSSKEDSKPKLEDSSLANTEIAAHRKIFHHVAAREGKDSSLFPNFSSAVSVLKSSGVNSWSAADNSLHVGYKFFIPVKRARSKRLRPPTLNPRLTIPFMVSYERRKVRKKILPSDASETEEPETPGGPNWKCTHCEMTKTPQWREGPMGPKTLCNACGVRYRSGRLYPEYRPAASPTFVASVHSNSHRKVVEMRNKGGSSVEVPVAAVASLRRAPQLGGNPNGCHRLSV